MAPLEHQSGMVMVVVVVVMVALAIMVVVATLWQCRLHKRIQGVRTQRNGPPLLGYFLLTLKIYFLLMKVFHHIKDQKR